MININIKKVFFFILVLFPVIYIYLEILSNNISRKLCIIVLIMLFIEILRKNNKKLFFSLVLVLSITLLNFYLYGVQYILHQDFYSFILFYLVCIFFSEKSNINYVERFLTKNFIIFVSFLYIFALFLSVIFFDGINTVDEWGTSNRFLYGPFEYPHILAYQLLALYVLASIGFTKGYKHLFLLLKFLFLCLIIWTGVRSAFLVLMIVVFFEYILIKSFNKKFLILLSILFAFVLSIYFLDFFYTNPIVSKTVYAINQPSGITNSRLDFITYLSKFYFCYLDIKQEIFGIGLNELRNYMYLRYGTELHSHNDPLNMLVGFGIIGLCMYLYALIKFCRTNKKWAYVFIPVIALSLTNGLYIYSAFTPCLPLFIILFKEEASCICVGKT